VKVVMRVHVIERKTRSLKRVELRGDLGGELPAGAAPEEHVRTGTRKRAREAAVAIDEVGNRRRRQHRRSVDEHEMQSDAKRRQASRARDRVTDGCAAHHQACGGKDAARVGDLDRFVDLARGTEVVRRDDQLPRTGGHARVGRQCAVCRRSRRNWKNSTPSRSRRVIICGLVIISPTIDAILPLRK